MKVLIAEDDHASNLLLKNLLFRWGFDIVTTFNGIDAWRILQEDDPPQIAILDWMMPEMDGLEVCRRVRESEKNGDGYIIIIILTARSDKDDIVTGIDAGADDYIVKPFDKDELRARLRTAQRLVELQTALRVANKKLLIMSRLDPLTGALNRTAIMGELDLAAYRASRERKPLTISLIDIDNLKEMNGRFGRGAGEKILQDSVRRISACLRRADFIGRSGGDEFLAIMPGVDLESGMNVCRRVNNVIAERPFVCNDQSIPVTVSQCLALWDGKAGIEELTASVERTLAETKGHGRNRIEKAADGPHATGAGPD
jgi:two-component system, cell cycle response regulator